MRSEQVERQSPKPGIALAWAPWLWELHPPSLHWQRERVTVATGTMLFSVRCENDACQWELSLGPCTVLLTTGHMSPTGTHKESHLCAQLGDDHTL